MSLQRRCRVLAVDHVGCRLHAIERECEGCVGCGGRCALPLRDGEAVELAAAQIDGELRVGDVVLLSVDGPALRGEAVRGYGLPLAGLLAGAVLAAGSAELFGLPVDPITAAGATAGTLLGLRASKRHVAPRCRVRPLQHS